MYGIKVDETNKVTYIKNLVFDNDSTELITIENIPVAQNVAGKRPIRCYDAVKGFYYEYEDIPKTQEELQAQKINDLEGAIMELTTIMSMNGGV